jgi:hypothetical protein
MKNKNPTISITPNTEWGRTCSCQQHQQKHVYVRFLWRNIDTSKLRIPILPSWFRLSCFTKFWDLSGLCPCNMSIDWTVVWVWQLPRQQSFAVQKKKHIFFVFFFNYHFPNQFPREWKHSLSRGNECITNPAGMNWDRDRDPAQALPSTNPHLLSMQEKDNIKLY